MANWKIQEIALHLFPPPELHSYKALCIRYGYRSGAFSVRAEISSIHFDGEAEQRTIFVHYFPTSVVRRYVGENGSRWLDRFAVDLQTGVFRPGLWALALEGAKPMPDMNQEMEHLAQAEGHIANGKKLIARLQQQIDRGIELGADTTEVTVSLEAMRSTLEQFIAHRDSIVKTVDDIRAGKYNN